MSTLLLLSSGPPPPIEETKDANLQKLTQLVNKESNLIEKVLLLSISLPCMSSLMDSSDQVSADVTVDLGRLIMLKLNMFTVNALLTYVLSCRWMTIFAAAPSTNPTDQILNPV